MMHMSSIAASQLSQQIQQHLDYDLPETANFLAGRLHALEPRNPDASHLLALTYYRLGRYRAAYDFSQKFGSSGRQLGCAYVFAQACLQLGRWTEGVAALEKSKAFWVGRKTNLAGPGSGRMVPSPTSLTVPQVSLRTQPDAAACYQLMARLWQGHGDMKKAGDCFLDAHKSNPFLWHAFEGLCNVGADLRVENMFRLPADAAGGATGGGAGTGSGVYEDDAPSALQPLAFNQQVFTPSDADISLGGVNLDRDEHMSEPPAPTARRVRGELRSDASQRPRAPASRGHTQSSSETGVMEEQRKASIGGHKRTISGAQPATASEASMMVDPSAPPRRSNRLFGHANPTSTTTVSSRSTRSAVDTTSSLAGRVDRTVRAAKAATGAKDRTGTTVGRVVSGNRKVMPPDLSADGKEKDRRAPSRNSSKDTVPTAPGVTNVVLQKPTAHGHPPISVGPQVVVQAEMQAMQGLLDGLRTLALGSYATARFDTPTATKLFCSLPSAQRETPYVLAQLGKAYYEAADYHNAEDCFARVLKLQSSRVKDMEVYSTVLWHLKKHAQLSMLCYVLRDRDYNAPETWCAVGNALSLAREHEQAISAFKRATQISEAASAGAGKGCEAYAYTLMGHEYIANEDFDSALLSFRKSVSVDRRNYGGWYGLGKSYERLGKFEDAERHYRIAASINPSNSTLLVCIGVVLERLGNKNSALANYTRALEIAPQSALARFKKARVLMGMRYFSEALVELEVLRDQAPDEANVWFLLGKCFKGLDEKSEALRALTTALNLDVKAAPFIKEAMEALDDEDEESEED